EHQSGRLSIDFSSPPLSPLNDKYSERPVTKKVPKTAISTNDPVVSGTNISDTEGQINSTLLECTDTNIVCLEESSTQPPVDRKPFGTVSASDPPRLYTEHQLQQLLTTNSRERPSTIRDVTNFDREDFETYGEPRRRMPPITAQTAEVLTEAGHLIQRMHKTMDEEFGLDRN
ncbi:unnamed protein product, partial [Didymodactylos carnosus]